MFVVYIIMGILEDLGFIPRVVASCHSCMRHLGMSGDAIIPIITGTGCSIVGILSSRTLRSEKSRVLSSSIQVFGVPCIAQQIMIWAILGKWCILCIRAVSYTCHIYISCWTPSEPPHTWRHNVSPDRTSRMEETKNE